jgi:hypothetical protein
VLGLVLFVAGAASLAAGWLVVRTVGIGYRVGRLLAAAPEVSVEEANELARSGSQRFVRVAGRVSSREEFPDENDRPLVFRRKRVEIADGRGGWRTALDDREAVPFGVETRSAYIAVDVGVLGEGLVVVPREARGIAADLPTDMVAELPESARAEAARLVVEQVSAVEHAIVCGQPSMIDGHPTLSAGMGRPLIVTTLEPAAAMRILAAGHRRQTVAAAALLGAGVLLLIGSLLTLALGVLASQALAASPSPGPSELFIDPLDPRTGASASLGGAPLLAALFVIALGVAAAAVAIAYSKLAARRPSSGP